MTIIEKAENGLLISNVTKDCDGLESTERYVFEVSDEDESYSNNILDFIAISIGLKDK